MENQTKYKDVDYHSEMLAGMIRNESHMRAIIALLIDIRSKLYDEPVPDIAEAIETQVQKWQNELAKSMTSI